MGPQQKKALTPAAVTNKRQSSLDLFVVRKQKRSASEAELEVLDHNQPENVPESAPKNHCFNENNVKVKLNGSNCENTVPSAMEASEIFKKSGCEPSTKECAKINPIDKEDEKVVDEDDIERPESPLPEGLYEVEAIRDYESRQFLVKWKGYPESDNTWEPIENLEDFCQEKMIEFYLERRRDFENTGKNTSSPSGEKRRKLTKSSVPPDPRPLDSIIDSFLESMGCQPDEPQLNGVLKQLRENSKIKRWPKEKVKKAISDNRDGKLKDDKIAELKQQAIFLKAEFSANVVKEKLKKWEKKVNEITNGCPNLTIENNFNLTGPPLDFKYINDYLPLEGVTIPDDPPMGCACGGVCDQKDKACCPSELGSFKTSYYVNKKIRAPLGTPIYECNKKCTCGPDCTNRVVQDGVSALADKVFKIFQTEDRGWGVKTMKTIKKGVFVCMYVGEIIPTAVADERGKVYDQEGCTYLFDLDFNETDGDEECPYTVDAAKFGNVAHFINHSCDPNLGVYGVWSNCLDPNLPKLALFALKDIPKGTELSFDYKRTTERVVRDPTQEDLPLIRKKECLCQSSNCKKYLF